MRVIKFISGLILLTLLSACGVSTGCDDFHSYRYAKVEPPVTVPSDLEQPVDESTAPVVNPEDPATVDRNVAGECLEKPPKL